LRGVALLQVFLNILLSDAQISLNARFWRFPLKFLLQPRKADAGTVLKFQTGRPKRIGLNFDGKFAYLGFVDHVKAICPKTGGNIETYILDVHARILIFAVRSTSTTRCWFISPEARRLLRLVVSFLSCLQFSSTLTPQDLVSAFAAEPGIVAVSFRHSLLSRESDTHVWRLIGGPVPPSAWNRSILC